MLQEDFLLQLAVVGVEGVEILVSTLNALLERVDAGGNLLGVGVVFGILLGVLLQAIAQSVDVDGLGEDGETGALSQLRDGLEGLTDARAAVRLRHEDVLALGVGLVAFPDNLAVGVGSSDAETVQATAEAFAAVPHGDALNLVQGHGLLEVELPDGEGHVLLGVGDGAAAPVGVGPAVDGAGGGAVVGGGALGGGALAGDVLAVLGDDLDLGQGERGALLGNVDGHVAHVGGGGAGRGKDAGQRENPKS